MARKSKAAALTSTGLPLDYLAFLESLKSRVRQAQSLSHKGNNPGVTSVVMV